MFYKKKLKRGSTPFQNPRWGGPKNEKINTNTGFSSGMCWYGITTYSIEMNKCQSKE